MSELTDNDLKAVLPEVIRITREAGQAIMAIYSQDDLGVKSKEDNSPVTLADMAAHQCIEQGLNALSLQLPVLSEESGNITWEERSQWRDYWLVDPLDGTKEFIKRNGEFTVNIALIRQGVPVLGVVYAPATEHLYYGCKGEGAWFEKPDSAPQSLSLDPEFSPQCWRIVGSRSHGAERMEAFTAVLPEYRNVPMGSSLKFCLVAADESDLYVRFGPTCEWDTAAAQAVVEQAGGQVLDTELKPLRYNTKESLLNPEFVVCQKLNELWSDQFKTLSQSVSEH